MVTPVVTSPCTWISTWFLQMVQPKSWFWSSKGGAGTKFRMLCANVHAAKKTCNDADPEEVHCDAKRYSQLQLVTNQQLLASYQRLHVRHGTRNKKEFAFWQEATGLSYFKFAIMLNQNLLSRNLVQPVSQFWHDWMHGILQGTATYSAPPYTPSHCSRRFWSVPSFGKVFPSVAISSAPKMPICPCAFASKEKNWEIQESHEI